MSTAPQFVLTEYAAKLLSKQDKAVPAQKEARLAPALPPLPDEIEAELRVMPFRLTVPQVAEFLVVDFQHVLNLADAGDLTLINIGIGSKRPTWRIDRASLQNFIRHRLTVHP